MSRPSIALLQRAVVAFQASRPMLALTLELHRGEPSEAWEARKAEAVRRVEAARAAGRRAALVIVDREEGQ